MSSCVINWFGLPGSADLVGVVKPSSQEDLEISRILDAVTSWETGDANQLLALIET
ncbi:MAG TPA: hypothetical protein PLN52_02510 [Opitutaceae bacterium]|nr:hypothetical protein [Opitutaceae bacterium]